MKWMIELGDDCDYEDYDRMLTNHELDDIMPAAREVVEAFQAQYPTVPIDRVTLVINKDATAETKIRKKGATAADNVQITFAPREKMTCFDCIAFGDDEQCYESRHSVDGDGNEGLDCPRIKQAVDTIVSDRRCAIEGCEADAEEIREVRIGSNTYCRKHFDEMFKEG